MLKEFLLSGLPGAQKLLFRFKVYISLTIERDVNMTQMTLISLIFCAEQ